jgi:hypothetical protein
MKLTVIIDISWSGKTSPKNSIGLGREDHHLCGGQSLGCADIVRTKGVALHRSHERLDNHPWKATPSMALFQRLSSSTS